MARTVIVGDLHACKNELLALLDWIGFGQDDRLVCVGDLIVRGPFPRGTLDLLAALGARAVRGNHEDKLLRHVADPSRPIGEQHRAALARLRRRHVAFLKRLPLWLDLPEHGVRVVHAGLVPGVPIEEQDPNTLMYVRALGPGGEPLEHRAEPRGAGARVERVLWGSAYEGPPHVVFGHNAMPEPQLHAWATGIDTGCVYGGRLTAMVLRDGERPPPVEARRDVLVSVPARRRYA
ncbi:MAG TPA: metallophosphoesterase family protein, partial [Minicystis sp.]|nr:metallophosphoesterase family protein [Minicystis sp.]